MIYLDNAATTNMSSVALQAFMEVSRSCYGNPSSVYRCGRKAKELIEESRRTIVKCIGALPEEVYFTSGGTESDNWAIGQTVTCGMKSVITLQIEYHAVLHSVLLNMLDMHDICISIGSRIMIKWILQSGFQLADAM